MMNATIDDVRRKEYKTNKILRKTRFIWLKNPENLSDKEKKKLHSMKDLDIKTAKAYQFKLALQRLWLLKDLVAAQNYLNTWYYWAAHSKIEEIVKLAETVHTHSYGILEAIRTGLNNSVAEGLNNKVKTVVKRSYGFKTAKYRNTMIYLVRANWSCLRVYPHNVEENRNYHLACESLSLSSFAPRPNREFFCY